MSLSVEGPPMHAAIAAAAKEVNEVRRKLEKSYRRSESLLVQICQVVDCSSKAADKQGGKMLVEKYTSTLKSARIERNELRKRESALMQEIFRIHGISLDVSQLFSPVPASPMLDRSLMKGMSPQRTSGQFLNVPTNASVDKSAASEAAEDERRVLQRLKRHLIAQISQFEQFRRTAESAILRAEADQTLETLRKDLASIEHELSLLPELPGQMRGAYSPGAPSPGDTPFGLATATRPPRPPSPQATVVGRLAAAAASVASPILPKKLNFSSEPAAAALVRTSGGSAPAPPAAPPPPAPAFRVEPSTPPKDEELEAPTPPPPARGESPEPPASTPRPFSALMSRLLSRSVRDSVAASAPLGPSPPAPAPPPPPPPPPAQPPAQPPPPPAQPPPPARSRTPISMRPGGSEAPPPMSPALFAPLSPIACPSPQPSARSEGHRSAGSGGAGSRRGSLGASTTGATDASVRCSGEGSVLDGSEGGSPCLSPDVRQLKALVDRLSEELEASMDDSVSVGSPAGSPRRSDPEPLRPAAAQSAAAPAAPAPSPPLRGSAEAEAQRPAAAARTPPRARPAGAHAAAPAAFLRSPPLRGRTSRRSLSWSPSRSSLSSASSGRSAGPPARPSTASRPAPARPKSLYAGASPSPPGNHVGLRASLKLAIPGRSRPAPAPSDPPPAGRPAPSPATSAPSRTAGPSSARVVICAPAGPRPRSPAPAAPSEPPPASSSLLGGGARRVPLSDVGADFGFNLDEPMVDDEEEIEEKVERRSDGSWWEDSDDSEDEFSKSAPA